MDGIASSCVFGFFRGVRMLGWGKILLWPFVSQPPCERAILKVTSSLPYPKPLPWLLSLWGQEGKNSCKMVQSQPHSLVSVWSMVNSHWLSTPNCGNTHLLIIPSHCFVILLLPISPQPCSNRKKKKKSSPLAERLSKKTSPSPDLMGMVISTI